MYRSETCKVQRTLVPGSFRILLVHIIPYICCSYLMHLVLRKMRYVRVCINYTPSITTWGIKTKTKTEACHWAPFLLWRPRAVHLSACVFVPCFLSTLEIGRTHNLERCNRLDAAQGAWRYKPTFTRDFKNNRAPTVHTTTKAAAQQQYNSTSASNCGLC